MTNAKDIYQKAIERNGRFDTLGALRGQGEILGAALDDYIKRDVNLRTLFIELAEMQILMDQAKMILGEIEFSKFYQNRMAKLQKELGATFDGVTVYQSMPEYQK